MRKIWWKILAVILVLYAIIGGFLMARLFIPDSSVINPIKFALRFGSWVGGDRDGHPYVTPEFTASTLRLHRRAALKIIRKELVQLARKLSFSEYLNRIPADFLDDIQTQAEKQVT